MADANRVQRTRNRRPGIRWTEKQRLELSRSIKNFNRRIDAAIKRGIDRSILPDKLSVKQERARITTSRELQRTIRVLSKATAKTLVPSIYGGKTVWESKVKVPTRPKTSTEDLRREEIAKNINVERSNRRFPTERDRLLRQIGLSGETDGRLEMIKEWLQGDNLRRSEQWRQNYLKTINENIQIALLNGDNVSASALGSLYSQIAQADLIDFLLGQLDNPSELAIGFLIPSPPSVGMTVEQIEDQMNAYQTLIESWQRYI